MNIYKVSATVSWSGLPGFDEKVEVIIVTRGDVIGAARKAEKHFRAELAFDEKPRDDNGGLIKGAKPKHHKVKHIDTTSVELIASGAVVA